MLLAVDTGQFDRNRQGQSGAPRKYATTHLDGFAVSPIGLAYLLCPHFFLGHGLAQDLRLS
jgi:hypothetical protein